MAGQTQTGAGKESSQLRVNPYNFERPVIDPRKFAGRFQEVDDVNYYLERAARPQPDYHNIAIIGSRGIGKTSFLYKIQSMAEDKGFLTVRFPLTEQIVLSEMEFFKQLFDAILEAAHKKGLFDGAIASIYRAYIKATSILDSNTQAMQLPAVPFYLVDEYIGWKRHNTKPSMSIARLKHDFALIRDEARARGIPAILILFDECNLFTMNKGLVQLLSTILGDPDLQGWMVVFSGTNEMFKLLSVTFSPILRQFVKVYLQGFRDVKETENCILLPLTEADKALFDYTAIDEIHRLTNGNPYEIQLVSFYMYRRYEQMKLPRITLDHQVLDSVLAQLEEERTAVTASHIPMIKNFSEDTLRDLQLVLPYEGWTVEQISLYDLISQGFIIDQKQDLEHEIGALRTRIANVLEAHGSNGLLRINKHRILFGGDRFDRLYLKYLAEANRIHWNMVVEPYHAIVSQKLREFLERQKIEHGWTRRLLPTERGVSVRQYINSWKEKLEDGTLDIEEEESEIFVVEDRDFVRSFVYNLRKPEFLPELLRNGENPKIAVALRYHFSEIGDNSIYLSLFVTRPKDTIEKAKNKVRIALDKASGHFAFLGITIDDIEAFEFKFLQLEQIAQNAVRKGNKKLLREIQLAFLTEGREVFSQDNRERSLQLFKTAIDLPAEGQDPLYLAIAHNNAGFVLGSLGRYDEAIHEWYTALALYPQKYGKMGMTYQDLSYVYFKLGKFDEALDAAKKAIETDHNMNVKVGWLFVKFCNTPFPHPSTWKWELITRPRVATASYCNMVAIYAEQNDFETALLYAKKAEQSSRDQPVVYRTQGWLALKMEDWITAIDKFTQAKEMDPKDPIIEEELKIAASIVHEKRY